MHGLVAAFHPLANPPRTHLKPEELAASVELPSHFVSSFVETNAGALLGRWGLPKPQPAIFSSDDLAVALEGIYTELEGPASGYEHSSAEGVARLYSRYGTDLPRHIQGAFVLVVHDRRKNRVFVCNDRFGLRPLYYYHDRTGLILSPNTRIGCLIGRVTPEINLDAVGQFLRYQQILDDQALFRGFELLPPASSLTYELDSGELSRAIYWSVAKLQLERSMSFEDVVEHGARLVRAAVLKSFASSRRVGLFLSGGLDSRIILASLGKQAEGMHAVNYGEEHSGDVVYARSVAKYAGVSLHTLNPEVEDWVEEFLGFFTRFSYSPLHYFNGGNNTIVRQARGLFDINLSGVMGDAVIGDLHGSGALLRSQDRLGMIEAVDHYWGRGHLNPGAIDQESAGDLFVPDFADSLMPFGRAALIRLLDEIPCAYDRRHDFLYLRTRARRCLGNLLHVEQSYLESRTPFYDYDLIDFFYSVPYVYRIERRLQIAILNRLSPGLSRIPTSGSNIPPTLNQRRTRIHYWRNRLRTLAHRHLLGIIGDGPGNNTADWPARTRISLRPQLRELLLGSSAHLAAYLKPDAVDSLLLRLDNEDTRAAWVLGALASLESSWRNG